MGKRYNENTRRCPYEKVDSDYTGFTYAGGVPGPGGGKPRSHGGAFGGSPGYTGDGSYPCAPAVVGCRPNARNPRL